MDEKMSKEMQEKLKEIYDSLTDEQKEKSKKCETMDEIIDLAGEEGIELPEELLKSAAGGRAVTLRPGRVSNTGTCR